MMRSYREEISQLLSESPAKAEARRGGVAQTIGRSQRGILLYGAGNLGRKALGCCRASGVKVLALADRNPAGRGGAIEGTPVVTIEQALRSWGTEVPVFITVSIGGGDEGMEARREALRAAGFTQVATFVELGWVVPGILPHRGADTPGVFLEAGKELGEVAALFKEPESQSEFLCQLRWRLRADFRRTSPPAAHQYFPPELILPIPNEAYVDCGAFDGDTLAIAGSLRRGWAIEPDPVSAARLRASAGPGIEVHEVALGDREGYAAFLADSSVGAGRCESAGTTVRVATLDGLICASAEPTFVKLDIEGDEAEALSGGRGLLERSRPTVAVCLYHRPQHLWAIPLFLKRVLPEHHFFLRVHQNDGYELVLYAVPGTRVPEATLRRLGL